MSLIKFFLKVLSASRGASKKNSLCWVGKYLKAFFVQNLSHFIASWCIQYQPKLLLQQHQKLLFSLQLIWLMIRLHETIGFKNVFLLFCGAFDRFVICGSDRRPYKSKDLPFNLSRKSRPGRKIYPFETSLSWCIVLARLCRFRMPRIERDPRPVYSIAGSDRLHAARILASISDRGTKLDPDESCRVSTPSKLIIC